MSYLITIRKTYKYRLYARQKSDQHLHQVITTAGMIWNHALALQKRYYRLTERTWHCEEPDLRS